MTDQQAYEDDRALDLIQEALDATEWDSDTVERIAHIVRRTGREIRDLED